MRCLIRVCTVYKYSSHFTLGICKFHSRTYMYLKLKLDTSNIECGRVYSVYNGLSRTGMLSGETTQSKLLWLSSEQR